MTIELEWRQKMRTTIKQIKIIKSVERKDQCVSALRSLRCATSLCRLDYSIRWVTLLKIWSTLSNRLPSNSLIKRCKSSSCPFSSLNLKYTDSTSMPREAALDNDSWAHFHVKERHDKRRLSDKVRWNCLSMMLSCRFLHNWSDWNLLLISSNQRAE